MSLPYEDQQEFNLRVWQRMLEGPELARIEDRYETDRRAHIPYQPSTWSFASATHPLK